MVNDIFNKLMELTIVKYAYGSFVYGTNDENSDRDYICVISETNIINDDEFQLKQDGCDYTFIKEKKFVNDIKNHDISALECIFLPSKFIDGNNDFIFNFEYDENKLRASISAVCSNSFVKAKKKLTVDKDFDFRKAIKSLFHSIRIFDFGIQIANNRKIIDYSSCSDLWINELSKETSTDWNYYKDKYKPLYNKKHSEFVQLARKTIN